MHHSLAVVFLFFLILPNLAFAQEAEDPNIIFHAKVLRVISETETVISGTDTKRVVQHIEVETDVGEIISFDNDRIPMQGGDVFFGSYIDTGEGKLYTVLEVDRRAALLFGVLLFVGAIVAVGLWTGIRALLSLSLSIAVIVFGLLPALVAGASPVVVSFVYSTLILLFAMIVTHGVSRSTAAAFSASIVTIFVAILLGEFFVLTARLSGLTDDASSILNFSTGGSLNMSGLLLGGLIIGVLGIIDDLAITQVLTVKELIHANTSFKARDLFQRAMRIGRGHLGAVVNTLVFAYVGTALPLLLFFTLATSNPIYLLNSEIVAIEIFRAVIGGVALALVLPTATIFGIFLLHPLKHPLVKE